MSNSQVKLTVTAEISTQSGNQMSASSSTPATPSSNNPHITIAATMPENDSTDFSTTPNCGATPSADWTIDSYATSDNVKYYEVYPHGLIPDAHLHKASISGLHLSASNAMVLILTNPTTHKIFSHTLNTGTPECLFPRNVLPVGWAVNPDLQYIHARRHECMETPAQGGSPVAVLKVRLEAYISNTGWIFIGDIDLTDPPI